MPKRIEVEVGTTFGRLTVLGNSEPYYSPRGQVHRVLSCACLCGAIVTVRLGALRNGTTTSCGCSHIEKLIARSSTHGQASGGGTANYRLWRGIKSRVVTPPKRRPEHYVSRGITMYAPWVDDFQEFDLWITENLGPCPKGCSLDRVDNDGNYAPGNLRWATAEEQNSNTRRNTLITWEGETLTLTRWAARQGLKWSTLWQRLHTLNWEVEKSLTTPVRSPKPREVQSA